MKKIGVIFILFIFQYSALKSQASIVYPSGYEPALDYEGKRQNISVDMDGDAWPDLAIVLSNKKNEKIIYVMRVGKYIVDSSYQWFPWDSDLTSFEFKDGKLHIASCFGNGRFCKTLVLKYYDNIENMRLIGYKEENFGNSTNEGAYLKTVNLLTSEYEIGGKREKFKADLITLSNIEKYFDFLEMLGANAINNNSQSIFNGKYVDKYGNTVVIEEIEEGEKIKYTLTGTVMTNCVNSEVSSIAEVFRINRNGSNPNYNGPEFWYSDMIDKCNIDIEPVEFGKSVKVIIANCNGTKCSSDMGFGNVYTKTGK